MLHLNLQIDIFVLDLIFEFNILMQKKGLQELALLKSQANQTCTLVNRLVDYSKLNLNGQIQDIRILVHVNTRILFLCSSDAL